MQKSAITLGLIQMAMAEHREENLAKASTMVADAARKGANVVVLPELFAGPYFCQYPKENAAFDRAEALPGPTTDALGALAANHKIVLIGGSIFENAHGRYYNTSCVFGPDGKLLGTYRKTHIPHDPGFHEQDYFTPGDTGIRVFDTPFGKICPMICYDQWFPEAARIATLMGAELIVYPTAIGRPDSIDPVSRAIPEDWEAHWRAAQVGHAAANCVFVAAVNRVGKEGGTQFFGGSFVANPGGLVIAQAGNEECVLTAECDLGYVRSMQEAWRFLMERRPDTYKELIMEN